MKPSGSKKMKTMKKKQKVGKKIEKKITKKSNKPSFGEELEDSSDGEELFTKIVKKPEPVVEENGNDSSAEEHSEDMELDSGDEDINLDPKKHMQSLEKLKKDDPEFYKFLQKNDANLLDFKDDDADSSDCDIEDKIHIPNENLEVDSEDSDYEGDIKSCEKSSQRSGKITLKLIKQWQDELQRNKSSSTIKKVVEAFHAALEMVQEPNIAATSKFKIRGIAVFNAVVQLCVLHLPNAMKRFLKLNSNAEAEAHKSKRFKKIKITLKCYFQDLIKILSNVTSSSIITVLLKHLHQMLQFTMSFVSLRKPLFKMLIKFWSHGEETVQVVAFMCILRCARHDKTNLESIMKVMYIKYVENSKFVSPNTLPGINFMRRSLTEIYLLDQNTSYTHAFLYIRQLAIQLRNAITIKKKENFQAVYNWQYINSLKFWTELLSGVKTNHMLQQLIYPLVQIITGTIKLIPTAQYYPLRFHCIKLLIDLSRATGIFIPSLPFALEVLNSCDFNKRHKSVTMKPISLICLLRMSKSQMQQNGFKNVVIENLYQLILENAAKDSHFVYFPDLYIPCIIQLKDFLKKNKIAAFGKQMKQLLDKIEENRKFIENERTKVTLDLKNQQGIKNWENHIKTDGTPLNKFYEAWYKIYESNKLKLLTMNDEVGDFNLPKVNNRKRPADDVDNSDLDMPVEELDAIVEKQKQAKKKKLEMKKKKRDGEKIVLPKNDNDIVRDANLDDWE